MSRVFEEAVRLKREQDGSFTLSIRLNDHSLIVRSITKADAERLYLSLMRELGDK